MKITYLRPGKAKQTGPNPNKQLRFTRKGLSATTRANVNRIANLSCQTAQDIFEKNYDALQKIRLILGR